MSASASGPGPVLPSTPLTLEVPAALYDEALSFCNARRAEKGRPAVDALPAGLRDKTMECPCASTCEGLYVSVGGAWWWAGGRTMWDGPTDFVDYFDRHAAPGVLTLPVRVARGDAERGAGA